MLVFVILFAGCGGPSPVDKGDTIETDDVVTAETPDSTWTPAIDTNPDPDIVEVDLTAAPLAWDPGTGVPLTAGLAFNGMVPGPVIDVVRGQLLRVHFRNDTTTPLTLHWHGLRVPEAMDGIAQMDNPVEPGASFDYEYTIQDVGMYWYHPHMDTAGTVEAGLAGGIRVREVGEQAPDVDIPVILDDVLLDQDDQIEEIGTPHDQVMGRMGDHLLFNGREGRTIGVEQGQTMVLRLVNASNARYWDLSLEGHTFELVGTDGGWLEAPVSVDHLVVVPGERALIKVALTGESGASYRLMNARFRLHDDHGDMMEIDPLGDGDNVLATFQYGSSPVAPAAWAVPAADPWTPSEVASAVGHHWLLEEDMMAGRVSIDGQVYPDVPLVDVMGGMRTAFEVQNDSEMHHPFHIHGNRFRILSLDGAPWTGPRGWEDTWDVPPKSTITVESELDNPGMWMYHCHILEHADRGMAGMMMVGG